MTITSRRRGLFTDGADICVAACTMDEHARHTKPLQRNIHWVPFFMDEHARLTESLQRNIHWLSFFITPSRGSGKRHILGMWAKEGC